MINIALFQPEIPPNTGNIIRLSANTGASLHLIKPLGFTVDDAKLKRAGLDYHDWAKVKIHENYSAFLQTTTPTPTPTRIIACSTKGKTCYADFSFQENDTLLFGPETRGLPKEILEDENTFEIIRIPMIENSRSLNLSNSVAIILYEAWRQLGFTI